MESVVCMSSAQHGVALMLGAVGRWGRKLRGSAPRDRAWEAERRAPRTEVLSLLTGGATHGFQVAVEGM